MSEFLEQYIFEITTAGCTREYFIFSKNYPLKLSYGLEKFTEVKKDIELQSLVAKDFLNQKRNKFLKIIILHYKWQEHAFFSLLNFQITCTLILQFT